MRKLYVCSFLLCIVVTLFSCSQPQQLVYQEVKNFRIGKIDFERPEVGMDLQFYNPNNFALSLRDANIDIYISNKFIGNAKLERAFTVPAADTFLMPVTLTADLKNVFPNTMLIVFNKEVTVKIQGSVKAGKGLMVTIPVFYEGKQKLNVF